MWTNSLFISFIYVYIVHRSYRYVLKKDLLKFEAIYPEDQKPVGYIRGLEIFPRSSVHHLQGSLNWIKHARSIKVFLIVNVNSLKVLYNIFIEPFKIENFFLFIFSILMDFLSIFCILKLSLEKNLIKWWKRDQTLKFLKSWDNHERLMYLAIGRLSLISLQMSQMMYVYIFLVWIFFIVCNICKLKFPYHFCKF